MNIRIRKFLYDDLNLYINFIAKFSNLKAELVYTKSHNELVAGLGLQPQYPVSQMVQYAVHCTTMPLY